MTRIENTREPELPNSLAGLNRPTIEEAQEAVRGGEQMIEDLQSQRGGKLLRSDPEMTTVVVGPTPDADILKVVIGE